MGCFGQEVAFEGWGKDVEEPHARHVRKMPDGLGNGDDVHRDEFMVAGAAAGFKGPCAERVLGPLGELLV